MMALLQNIITFLGGAFSSELIRTGLDKIGDVVVKEAEPKILTDYHPDVVEVLRLLEARDPVAAEQLQVRLRQALADGTENSLVYALGKYIPREEGKVNWDEAVIRFQWFAGKDLEEFECIIHGLIHDPIAQFVRRWVVTGLGGALSYLNGAAAALADHLQPTADAIERRVNRGGIMAWLRFW